MRLTAAIALSLSLLSYAAAYQCEPHPLLTLAPINLSSYYTYTTPAHQGPRLGVISFTLQNDQTDDTTECSGSSQMSFGWFYATQTFNCTSPSGETSFSFDSITKAVSLNTLWTCGGLPYSTTASGNVSLKCETTTWRNPEWELGELYSNWSTVCQDGALIIRA